MKKCIQLILAVTPIWANSQTEEIYTIDKIKVTAYVEEVYQNCPEYTEERYFDDYLYKIGHTEIIKIENEEKLSQYDLLTTVSLNKKCNLALTHDTGENFSPERFNPLKYFFPFYEKNSTVYRVDGTNYVIRIKRKQ